MSQIIHLLVQYKYLWLFPLAIVEGPILAVIAGFLCSEGYLNPFMAFILIVLGDIMGDSLCYLIGRKGIPGWLKRLGRRMGLESKPIDDIRGVFERNPARTISLSKITLGIGVAGIYLAGHAKIPYSKFIQVCLLTSCIQYVFYLGLGILFGSAYQEISHYLDVFAAASILIVMAMILFLFIQSKLKKI